MAGTRPPKPGAATRTPVKRPAAAKPLTAGIPSAATAGVLRRLGEEVASISDPAVSAHIRIGQVTAVDLVAVTATVAYGAGSGLTAISGHHWVQGAQPEVNDYVMVVSQDGDNWIAGIMATSAGAAEVLPACRRSRTTAATAGTSGAFTAALGWNVADFDTASMASGGSDISIPVTGIYTVTFGLAWVINTTGRRIASAYRNGSEWHRNEIALVTAASGITMHHSSRSALLTAGDTLDLRIFQTSGGSLDTRTDAYALPFLEAIWQSAS